MNGSWIGEGPNCGPTVLLVAIVVSIYAIRIACDLVQWVA